MAVHGFYFFCNFFLFYLPWVPIYLYEPVCVCLCMYETHDFNIHLGKIQFFSPFSYAVFFSGSKNFEVKMKRRRRNSNEWMCCNKLKKKKTENERITATTTTTNNDLILLVVVKLKEMVWNKFYGHNTVRYKIKYFDRFKANESRERNVYFALKFIRINSFILFQREGWSRYTHFVGTIRDVKHFKGSVNIT